MSQDLPSVVEAAPPEELRARVAGRLTATEFIESGERSVSDYERALGSIGRRIGGFKHLLDWGCGCGRTLRALARRAGGGPQLYGCDIDEEAVGWVSANLPSVLVSRNHGLPPLAYPDGAFDLIVNHSVLTHLDETYQNAWLHEISRVLSPDGVAVLTVQGAYALDLWASTLPPNQPEVIHAREALKRTGFHFLKNDSWQGSFPSYYQSTFHTAGYVFGHWAKYFDILNYQPRGSLDHQDMIVLGRKRARLESGMAPLPTLPTRGLRAARRKILSVLPPAMRR